jgi:Putative beta-barrel porin-2, OmpL-like. bbp2/Carboxypeptidase regulatory-like domain
VPAPEAQVVVHSVDENTDRTAVSSADGTFAIVNLKPGRYQLTANKPGFASSRVTELQLAAGQSPRVDITLGPSVLTEKGGFFRRLGRAYKEDWTGTAPSGPPPSNRGLRSPISSPPFPFSDWPYGGSPDIGFPDTTVYPLMTAIYGGSNGEGWKKSRVKIYGWLEPSLNLSTSRRSNFPTAYDIFANRIELDQFVVYFERLPDTVQTDHFDWGFHLTSFFGIDYRFTTAKGYFSQQLLLFNRQYGFDPVMEYVDLYWGQVAKGLNIRIGRYISVPDIEAQLAPNNYTFTHSLLYTFDPFTNTGIIATLKLNNRWLLQFGVTVGHDVAPWTNDVKPSGTFCVNHTFNKGNDNVYSCANGINSGRYAYNNLQQFVVTWYHKFNESVHMASESWYMFERQVPSIFGPFRPELGANPAFCPPGQARCLADEWAIVNYVEKQLSPKDYISIRSDFFDDLRGQRTGFKTKYTEWTLGWGHWIGTTILFRPEVRFDRSWDVPVYDAGTRNNQFSFAMDVIFRF